MLGLSPADSPGLKKGIARDLQTTRGAHGGTLTEH